MRAAAANGLRITHVTETHIHADFVSGSRELAHRTGAVLYLSDEGDADWKYQFPTAEEQAAGIGVQRLHDGDRFSVGNIRLRRRRDAGTHAGAPGVPGHRHGRRRPPDGCPHRRFHLRR